MPNPAPTSPTFIVSRADDLVLLAVTFVGFTRTPAPTAEGFAAFVAGAAASLSVAFPPQAAQEQRLPEDYPLPELAAAGIATAGRSTLSLGVDAGTIIPATVAGVLAALDGSAFGPRVTELEIPAGLVLRPTPRNDSESVTPNHPSEPRRNGDTTALWQSDLRAPSGLSAIPVRVTDNELTVDGGLSDADFPIGPLYRSQAQAIVDAAAVRNEDGGLSLPRVDRLALSAIGGTLIAQGSWRAISWQHDMALGRDRRVQVTQRGVLLPFGHSAVLVQLAERMVEDDGTAAVRTRTTLYIDPVREYSSTDVGLTRQFPFDRVDVLVSTVDGLKDTYAGRPNFTPTIGNTAVAFPVRLFGSQGPIDITTPMIFVGTQTDPVVPPSGAAPAPAPPHPPGPHPPPHPVQVAEQVGVAPADLGVPGFAVPGFTPSPLGVGQIDVPAARIDLVRAAMQDAADIHLVHGLTVRSLLDTSLPSTDPAAYFPVISSLTVDLPAVRAMLPAGSNTLVQAALSQDLVANGDAAQTVLSGLQTIGADGLPTGKQLAVDFAKDTQRAGALVNPAFVADTVSRTLGPVKADLLDAVNGAVPMPDLSTIFSDATLLGVTLTDVIDDAVSDTTSTLPIPAIVEGLRSAEEIASGTPPTVTMSWTDLPLKSAHVLICDVSGATLTLTAEVGADTSTVSATLKGVGLALPDHDTQLLTLAFTQLVFTATKGSTPKLTASGVKATFKGALELLKSLEDEVDLGDAGQIIKVTDHDVTASYALSVPEVSAGMFDLRNIDFRSSVVVPFDGSPITVAVSFASRDNPFTLAVLAFGGGGYVDLLLDSKTGLQHFEGSLDFGAQLAVNFGVAAGEVHAFGGVRFSITGTDIEATAFLRFGGSLQLLGVVTVSIELSVDLTYADKALTGRAKLVIEVDISIWSDSVELDTGEWTLVGGDDPKQAPALAGDPGPIGPDQLAAWRQYREAFAA